MNRKLPALKKAKEGNVAPVSLAYFLFIMNE
jgi:hypothetical protein